MGMQVAGMPSWRLDTKGGYASELALFVRDACGLVAVGPGADVPRLVGEVPDLAVARSGRSLQAAGAQWSSWWQQLVGYEFRDGANDPAAPRDRARRRLTELTAVCDQPGFENLADRPQLRAAARLSFASFREWEAARPHPWRVGLSGSVLEWSLMKQVAEDVAFDRQVSIGAVRGAVAILPVEGSWWRRVARGGVQCSTSAAADPLTAHALLRDAFESSVAA